MRSYFASFFIAKSKEVWSVDALEAALSVSDALDAPLRNDFGLAHCSNCCESNDRCKLHLFK